MKFVGDPVTGPATGPATATEPGTGTVTGSVTATETVTGPVTVAVPVPVAVAVTVPVAVAVTVPVAVAVTGPIAVAVTGPVSGAGTGNWVSVAASWIVPACWRTIPATERESSHVAACRWHVELGKIVANAIVLPMLFPASTARAMLAGFRVLGLDTEVLQREAGLDSTVLARMDGAFEPDCFPRLWAAAVVRIARDELPTELGMAVPRGAFGAVDYLAGSSADVASGMQALARHFRQVSTSFSVDVTETEDGSGLVRLPCHEPFDGRFVSDEFTLSVIFARFRASANGSFRVHNVCLTRPQPSSKSRHTELFDAKVQFGCAVSSIEVPSDAWRLPLRYADPALQQTLRALSNHLEFGTEAHDLPANVRMHLRVLLPDGGVTAAKVARCLCLSERTLQRQLSGIGTSFTRELDNFRQVEAERLLCAGVPRIEVAFRLGFADQTTWNRAFRRWKGMPPSKWLEQQGAAAVQQSKASKT